MIPGEAATQRILNQASSVADVVADELEAEMSAGNFPGMDAAAVIYLCREIAKKIRDGMARRTDA